MLEKAVKDEISKSIIEVKFSDKLKHDEENTVLETCTAKCNQENLVQSEKENS